LHHQTVVELTSAEPMDAAQTAELVQKISTQLKTKVLLKEKIDARLLGGFTVKVEDRLFDGSIAGALATIKKDFKDISFQQKN